MKNLLVCILLLVFTIPVLGNTKIPIQITNISDGDTVKAKIDKNEFKIRLVGIDCYETCKIHRAYKQAYENKLNIDDVMRNGKLSKHYLQNLYEINKNKNIYLEFKGVDVYGRVLGVLYFDRINVNEEMKNHGVCMLYEF